jgi:hypothetical protein
MSFLPRGGNGLAYRFQKGVEVLSLGGCLGVLVHTSVCQTLIRLAEEPQGVFGGYFPPGPPTANVRGLEFPTVEMDSTWLILNELLKPFPFNPVSVSASLSIFNHPVLFIS